MSFKIWKIKIYTSNQIQTSEITGYNLYFNFNWYCLSTVPIKVVHLFFYLRDISSWENTIFLIWLICRFIISKTNFEARTILFFKMDYIPTLKFSFRIDWLLILKWYNFVLIHKKQREIQWQNKTVKQNDVKISKSKQSSMENYFKM